MWTQVVWSVQWAREVRAVVMQQIGEKGQITGHAVLSTPGTRPAHEVIAPYQSHFETELIFRDAKQFIGSQDAQPRSQPGIETHWSVVSLTLNLCRLGALRAAGGGEDLMFSLKNMKRWALPASLAQVILPNPDPPKRFGE